MTSRIALTTFPHLRDRLRASIPASHGTVISRRQLACWSVGGLPRFACPPSFGRRETRHPNEGPVPSPLPVRGRQTTSDTINPKNQPSVKAGQVHSYSPRPQEG